MTRHASLALLLAGCGGALPTVTVLAPPLDARLFAETRYDLLVRVEDGTSAVATADGADVACSDLAGEILHCAVVPTSAGTLQIDVTADGPAGATTASVARDVAEARGVVPRGDRFALGMYEVMDETWFEPVSSAGFALAQSYGTGAYTQLDWQGWAAAAGMQTMARTSWSWSDPWGEPYSDDELAALAALPQIAWWELPDAVVDDASQVDEVAAWVARIRAFDDRPVFLYLWTSTPQEVVEAYVPHLDVVAPGTYPEHACQPQPWIRWRITSAVEAVENAGYTPDERPVVGTATLFDLASAMCEPAELPKVRMQPLAMIAAGARGVLYFAWWYAVNSLDPTFGDAALETGRLVAGEAGLGLAVVHGEALGDLDVTVTAGPETSEAFVPDGATGSVQYPSIHAAAWDYAGTRFVIAVNYTPDAVQARIGGFPVTTPGVEAVGEDRIVAPEGGVVSESFEGWGAHVYRAPIVPALSP